MRGTFEIERMDPQLFRTLTSMANGLLKVGSAIALYFVLAI